MKDPKLLLGAGILAAWLLTSGKTKTSSKGSGNLTPEQDGELGESPGIGGKCKDGLILKQGVCQLPSVDDEKNETDKNKDNSEMGTNGGGTNLSSLVISSKCDKFTFGDGTGETWWKNKGKKIAKTWVDTDWNDPLRISYGMLQKNKEACFKDFPIPEEFDDKNQFYYELINWIREYPQIWELTWFVRNKIDDDFFNGTTSIVIDPKTMKVKYGNKFDNDLYINDVVAPFASLLLNVEESQPGFLLNNKSESKDFEQIADNVTTYVYSILFPNLESKSIIARFNKGVLKKDPVWAEIRKHFGQMGGDINVGS